MKKMGWALVGTGIIVKKFLAGLRTAQGVGEICVVSRSLERARAFAAENGLDHGYDDIRQALENPNVDVVYIGTPHTQHRECALAALKAKKGVLCEKPVSVSAWEMEEMQKAALENGAFFMEAMWTRFMPAVCKVREWIQQGQIGEVKMVQANFGFQTPWNPEWRLLNPWVGGGALLDAGIYPISMSAMAFAGHKVQEVKACMSIGQTGVDEAFMGVLSFGEGRMASVNAAIRTNMQSDAWIYGETGRIHMPDFVFGRSAILQSDGRFVQPYTPEVRGNGYAYEAEEVMNCIREGKLESGVMPMDESLALMRVMDEVRGQCGLRYPFEEEGRGR
ncbi:MAG: Gfo/Idh/MocA family oxidoreductase [Candidatus Limiplasma sp.]|nr:Gfo/Idh/MocA family oxidoreductase [Candidatus Limiplasma sp.]